MGEHHRPPEAPHAGKQKVKKEAPHPRRHPEAEITRNNQANEEKHHAPVAQKVMHAVARHGAEGHRQVGACPDRSEPGKRNPGVLHVGLDQPDRVKRGDPEHRIEEDGVAQVPVVPEGVPGRRESLRQMGAGVDGAFPGRVPELPGDEEGGDPDADLEQKGEHRRVGVDDPGKQSPGGLADLAETVHPPFMARIGVLFAFRPQRLVEQGAVGSADEGKGHAEQYFGQEHRAEGTGDGIDPPADDAQKGGDIERAAVAEPVADISRRVIKREGCQRKDALQQKDLGQRQTDMVFPEKGDDRHREQRHLQEGERVKLADIAVQVFHKSSPASVHGLPRFCKDFIGTTK